MYSPIHYNMLAKMDFHGSKGEERTQNFLGGKCLKRANAKQRESARLWITDGAAVARMVMEKGSQTQCKDGLEADPENQYHYQSTSSLLTKDLLPKSSRKSRRKDILSYHLIYSRANYKLAIYYHILK